MSAAIVPVRFHDDTILTVVRDGEPLIVLRPLCEHFGLDLSSQLSKLKAKAWATVVEITTVAGDGKERGMACLPLRCLAAWLLSINPGKVAISLREPLVRYQREAADALYKHFFAPAGERTDLASVKADLAEIKAQLIALPGQLAQALENGLARGVEAGVRLAHAPAHAVPLQRLAPPSSRPSPEAPVVAERSLSGAISVGERDRILGVLLATGGNRTAAAELLGLPRRTFYRRLKTIGVC